MALACAVRSVEAVGDAVLLRVQESLLGRVFGAHAVPPHLRDDQIGTGNPGDRRSAAADLIDHLVELLARGHREAVADVEHGLAAGDARQRVDQELEGPEGPQNLVTSLQGIALNGRYHVHTAGFELVHREHGAQGRPPVLVRLNTAGGGDLLDLQERLVEGRRVPGERLTHLEAQVVGGQHHPVQGADVAGQELADLLQGALAVLRPQVNVVDQHHQVQPVLRGRLRGSGGLGLGLRGSLRRNGHEAARHGPRHGREVGDRDRLAILLDLEVFFAQACYPVAVLVGNVDLDVDDVDLHDIAEAAYRGRRGWRGRLGEERGAAGDQRQEGEQDLELHGAALERTGETLMPRLRYEVVVEISSRTPRATLCSPGGRFRVSV